MAIFKQTPGPSNPRDSFLVEGGMPRGNSNTYQDLSSGLTQLQQFMDDVPQSSSLGNWSLLLMTVPTPMEVDTNASPSKETIQQSMIRMDKKRTKRSTITAADHPTSLCRNIYWRDFVT
ncbi:hypothetical protein DSO57_1019311 [Entomophthora muscae]|uniref:Uncharacterized protein n=1 Tax=Entomophthora muscae TaxID=34485 RepID=A0ACC2RV67_9FUNG|nr:hypothetical protein DSO57_1019311 [Entomophthora muscae]